MQYGDLTVEVRDKSLTRVGVIRPEELILTLEDQFNNIGSWTLTLAAEHPLADVLRTPGSGIIVTGPTDVLMSGPMTTPMFDARADDPVGTVTITGVSDTIVLADSLAFPQPSNVNPTTQTQSHDVRSGSAETVMHGYVNANVGPSAPAARRKTGLIMGANLGRGPIVKKSARFQVLGNLLDDIAIMASLGFRVVQRGTNLVFETYAIADRSAYIRLDVQSSTLASSKYALSPPGATQVIVAGQGELVDRQFYAATSTEATAAEVEWGRRIERFVDQRQTADSDEHIQKAKEVLADEGFTGVHVQAVPTDDTTMRFGTDWYMGDMVSIVVDDFEARSIVTGYVLKADSNGVVNGVTLGDPAQFQTGVQSAHRLTDVERRVSYLEASEGGAQGAIDASTDNAVFNFMGVF